MAIVVYDMLPVLAGAYPAKTLSTAHFSLK